MAGLPGPGFIPGELHLHPDRAPQVPEGQARPFGPGEFNRNPDGSWSSEESMTLEHPTKEGKWTNIPSLWLKDGKPYVVHNEDEAQELAARSGLDWPAYDSEKAADQAAANREIHWQTVEPGSFEHFAVQPLYEDQTFQTGGAVPMHMHEAMIAARLEGHSWQDINQFIQQNDISTGGHPGDLDYRLRAGIMRGMAPRSLDIYDTGNQLRRGLQSRGQSETDILNTPMGKPPIDDDQNAPAVSANIPGTTDTDASGELAPWEAGPGQPGVAPPKPQDI